MGHTTNPDIRIAKSVVDYIFRWLGVTFLPGYREASNGLPHADAGQDESTARRAAAATAPGMFRDGAEGNGKGPVDAAMLERAGATMRVDENAGPISGLSGQFARFQSDAPSCDNCGAITVRNGNCYLCYNCGNSMGCS
jgi:ribonucleoside-diphosphate reductase alpha chain